MINDKTSRQKRMSREISDMFEPAGQPETLGDIFGGAIAIIILGVALLGLWIIFQ